MKGYLKRFDKEKALFKTVYCSNCNQRKVCGKIIFLWKSKVSWEYCCSCAYQMEQARVQEYSSYQQVYQRKEQEQKERFQQLQLLRNYQGCKQCGSLAVDAYSLYEENRLVCQPCRLVKESKASEAISFVGQSKWYKRCWRINLTEWLKNFSQLPVNKKCADKWKESKEHLNNCDCLKVEAKELYLLSKG